MIRTLLLSFALSLPLTAAAQGAYPINFDKGEHAVKSDRMLLGLDWTGSSGRQTLTCPTATPYVDLTSATITARPGDAIDLKLNYVAPGQPWMHSYVYVDAENDGDFTDEGDLVAYSYYNGRDMTGKIIAPTAGGYGNALNPPRFRLPDALTSGRYRLRVKVDWNNVDPGGALGKGNDPKGENGILANRGAIVDTWLEIKGAPLRFSRLSIDTRHANIYGVDGALPMTVPSGEKLALRIVTPDAGYRIERFAVRHGRELDGPSEENGERRWSELDTVPDASGRLVLPPHLVDGDVRVIAHYAPGPTSTYLPAFADEFDSPVGGRPDPKFWSATPRRNATWNRRHYDSPATVFVKDGELVCRAMATPDSIRAKGETIPFVTGGVQTEGKFSFRYGRAEARIYNRLHTGNFPAFWMMPAVGGKGWPHEGEIDVWEAINTENTAYHTLHTNWTYNLKHKSDPVSNFVSRGVDYSRYHTFAVEWNPTSVTWYLDGKQVGTARKSQNADALANGQWPFTHPFYLICNQSVGDGSWAHQPDMDYVYETRFDWVRVYQTREQNPLVGIDAVRTDAAAQKTGAGAGTSAESSAAGTSYDLTGRKAGKGASGILIRDGRKIRVAR